MLECGRAELEKSSEWMKGWREREGRGGREREKEREREKQQKREENYDVSHLNGPLLHRETYSKSMAFEWLEGINLMAWDGC